MLVLLQPENGLIWWASDPGLKEGLVSVGLVAAMMLIGIIIDRRAFVTSGLISLGAAILVLARAAQIEMGGVAAMAVMLVGIVVLVLGIGWLRLRRLLLAALPQPVRSSLPPVS